MKVLIFGSVVANTLGVGGEAQPTSHRSGLRAGQRWNCGHRALRSGRPKGSGFNDRRRRGRAADLTIVGPELPLSLGIVDALQERGCACSVRRKTRPCSKAARASPSDFCSVTTFHGQLRGMHQPEELGAAIEIFHPPIVVKADGLAAGKGVIICPSRQTAHEAAIGLFEEQRWREGNQVVIEEFLLGDEISFLCLTDGKHVAPLAPRRIINASRRRYGPNTGGMASTRPTPCSNRR